MKSDNEGDVSSMILKKAHKNWFSGLMPGNEFMGTNLD